MGLGSIPLSPSPPASKPQYCLVLFNLLIYKTHHITPHGTRTALLVVVKCYPANRVGDLLGETTSFLCLKYTGHNVVVRSTDEYFHKDFHLPNVYLVPSIPIMLIFISYLSRRISIMCNSAFFFSG